MYARTRAPGTGTPASPSPVITVPPYETGKGMVRVPKLAPAPRTVTGTCGITSQANPVLALGRTEISKVPGSVLRTKSPEAFNPPEEARGTNAAPLRNS